MTELRLAVISDLHAYAPSALQPGERPPSFLNITAPADQPGQNPVAALRELIERNSLVADALICCGDIGDKAHPEATQFAWREVRGLADALGAADLIVTTGNHDVDSRYNHNDYDALGVLQGLPSYPFQDDGLNNEYWARNVVVLDRGDYRFVVLNSSAYHGHQDEWQHGRVSKRTIAYLKAKLQMRSDACTNILICHHHIYRIGSIDLADYSEMVDASALLTMLAENDFGRWLIIHGHRHWPHITYAPGQSSSPVVFSAGSLSAVLYDELQDKARNQFYILDVDLSIPATVRGRFHAWDWISDSGFQPARDRSGLPATGGFGIRMGGDELADRIAAVIAASGSPFMSWSSLQAAIPGMEFVAPADLVECARVLESKHSLPVLSHNGSYRQVGD